MQSIAQHTSEKIKYYATNRADIICLNETNTLHLHRERNATHKMQHITRNRPECSKAARRRPKRTHKTEQNGKAARRARYSETDVLHLNHRRGRKPQPLKRQKANEQTATTQRAKAHTAKPPRFLVSTHTRHTHRP